MLSSPPSTSAPESAAASRATCSHMSSGSGARPSGASSGCQVWRATPMMQVARGSLTVSAVGSGARLAGHGDGPVGDDVLLDLGGTPADGRVALEGVEPGPLAPVDSVGPAPRQHARRPEQV